MTTSLESFMLNHGRIAASRQKARARWLASGAAAAALALVALPSHAQSTTYGGTGMSASTSTEASASYIPYTSAGYVGLNLGSSDYNTACAGNFGCDDNGIPVKLYLGGMVNEWLGVEFGYLHTGEVSRNGGDTQAYGVNLSVVGNLPLNDSFSLFAKLGGTFGKTKVTANLGSGIATGSETGWGGSGGVGVSYKINRNWSASLEYEQHNFDFVSGNDSVDLTTVGLQYRF